MESIQWSLLNLGFKVNASNSACFMKALFVQNDIQTIVSQPNQSWGLVLWSILTQTVEKPDWWLVLWREAALVTLCATSCTFSAQYPSMTTVCFCFQSITLKDACKAALTILKQVMEEKLNSTNVEVSETRGQLLQQIFFFCSPQGLLLSKTQTVCLIYSEASLGEVFGIIVRACTCVT